MADWLMKVIRSEAKHLIALAVDDRELRGSAGAGRRDPGGDGEFSSRDEIRSVAVAPSGAG